jgi:uncharacterized repeat protein (TIGR01451 family)
MVVDDGTSTTFPGVYEVRRSIGLDPAMGSQAKGTITTLQGWGFADGTVAANTITVGGVATIHLLTNITSGYFSVAMTLNAKAAAGPCVVNVPGQESFSNAYHAVVANSRYMAMVPVVIDGLPNQAFQIKGNDNWKNGVIAANSVEVRDPAGLVSATAHAAITIAGKTFPATWVAITSPVGQAADRVRVTDPGATVDSRSLVVKRTLGICPVYSGGMQGFSATVTGFGFTGSAAISAITVGGYAASYNPVTAGTGGDFGPTALSLPALPNGDLDIVVNDGAARTFPGLYHARRSIGLSFVAGPGTAGDSTSIKGTGFTASSSILANTITFGGNPTTHAVIAVAADGSYPWAAVTLSKLDAGPYDVSAQEVFTQAYRVYNPIVDLGKFSSPPSGAPGAVVTFSFSFTNTGIVGDPRAASFILYDTIPAGMQYVSGSTTFSLPATVDWYHSGCSCFTGVDVPASDVTHIRWTLSSPLPSGQSGYTSFQVPVQ